MIKTVAGKFVNIHERKIVEGVFTISEGKISSFEEKPVSESVYLLPGFIDAHIHIESSMLVPYEFARIALTHGTVATVSDPHEIANVLGLEGVYYMLDNAKDALLKFNFGAPSCVPATTFESAGAVMDAKDIETLIKRDDIRYLSEMMNYPGVLYNHPEVMEKIAITKKHHKPIDGHAPGLRGADAKNYIAAGISTDHECYTLEEAQEKIVYGMKILIREGSAARNYDALHSLLKSNPDSVMFCSDDKHPDELLLGHINQLVKKSIALGYDLFDVLFAACIHPIEHYKLDVGQLRMGDPADFIVCTDLTEFNIEKTFINGICVSENAKCILPPKKHNVINNFSTSLTGPEDFMIRKAGEKIRVIEVYDGQLITGETHVEALEKDGLVTTDISNDVLKISVVNRYSKQTPALAFIRNFGLKRGAIASSVAHDSHNIIVVGVDDISISKAVNAIIEQTGGLSLVDGEEVHTIALPVAGLMSDLDGESIGLAYSTIDKKAKELGSKLNAPYMSLSFMALLVIPQLKLSDKGLFDGKRFQFSDLFCE